MSPRRKTEWFDDDAFWQELYPFMFPEERFTQTPEQIEKVLALTKPAGKTALDLCCGPGRCSVVLAQAGFQVTGVRSHDLLLSLGGLGRGKKILREPQDRTSRGVGRERGRVNV